MPFQKGYTPWNKNKKCPQISKRLKGKKFTKEHCKNISEANKGEKHFWRTGAEYKKGHKFFGDLSKPNYFQKGNIPWNKGKRDISFSERQKGEKNGNWKGGITPENERIRHNIKFREWREKIFKRDNWTCQKCEGKTYKGLGKRVILHPHHIFNFAQFINFRFEVFNGITFCEKCHEKFHKIYGRSNNNREQINEFIQL